MLYGLPCRTGYRAAQDTAPYGIRSHMRYHAVRKYRCHAVRDALSRAIPRRAGDHSASAPRTHLPTLASLRSSVIVAREGFGE